MSGYWYLETNVQLSNEKPNLWARIENVKMGLRCGQAPGTQVRASTSGAGGRGGGQGTALQLLLQNPRLALLPCGLLVVPSQASCRGTLLVCDLHRFCCYGLQTPEMCAHTCAYIYTGKIKRGHGPIWQK